MINFMVLAGPRSATTWLANLLTTDETLCLHDPFLEYTADQLQQIHIPGRRIGISCTAALLHPEWVLAQRCPKILIYRDPREINASLRVLGMNELDHARHLRRMQAIPGAKMYDWRSAFRTADAVDMCKRLGVPFDLYRFRQLVNMNIQPQYQQLPLDREAVQEWSRRVTEVGL
jgi:hypothetical protein